MDLMWGLNKIVCFLGSYLKNSLYKAHSRSPFWIVDNYGGRYNTLCPNRCQVWTDGLWFFFSESKLCSAQYSSAQWPKFPNFVQKLWHIASKVAKIRFNWVYVFSNTKSCSFYNRPIFVLPTKVQANLDLRKSIFPVLNRVMFDLRKIYVLNLKNGRPNKCLM